MADERHFYQVLKNIEETACIQGQLDTSQQLKLTQASEEPDGNLPQHRPPCLTSERSYSKGAVFA
jgi:hypothetical protein